MKRFQRVQLKPPLAAERSRAKGRFRLPLLRSRRAAHGQVRAEARELSLFRDGARSASFPSKRLLIASSSMRSKSAGTWKAPAMKPNRFCFWRLGGRDGCSSIQVLYTDRCTGSKGGRAAIAGRQARTGRSAIGQKRAWGRGRPLCALCDRIVIEPSGAPQ